MPLESAFGTRVFTLSATMSGDVLWVREHPHGCHHSVVHAVLPHTLHSSLDQCHHFVSSRQFNFKIHCCKCKKNVNNFNKKANVVFLRSVGGFFAHLNYR